MKKIKLVVLKTLHQIGIFRVFRWWNRNGVIILYAHGVADCRQDSTWEPLRSYISTDSLKEQIGNISRSYSWVTLESAVKMIEGTIPVEPFSIAITFDDGYRNNKTNALSILSSRNIIPTFFIATAYSDNRKPFVFDRLDYAIQHIRETVKLELKGTEFVFEPGGREAQRVVYAQLRAHGKETFDSDESFANFFESLCEQIEAETGKSLTDVQSSDPWSATLSRDEILELAKSGSVVIGSHTVDHVRLDKVDAEICSGQLVESKKELEATTGRQCDQFCYPNGNVNAQVARLVKEAGYSCAVSTVRGHNRVGTDLYQLKRIHLPVHADRIRTEAMLCGFDGLVARIKSVVSK